MCFISTCVLKVIMLIIFAIFTVLTVSVVAGEECVRNGVSCPEYAVLEKHVDYEERLYQPLVWISTSAVAKSRSTISGMLIKRLYGYLGGANDKGEQVDMMVPVRTTKITEDGINNYTMSIAVAPMYQEDTPYPTHPLVTLQWERATTYVTRSFGGMIRQENEWDYQSELLKSSVMEDDNVETSFYFWGVYDSPWTEGDRLNEVWMRKTVPE